MSLWDLICSKNNPSNSSNSSQTPLVSLSTSGNVLLEASAPTNRLHRLEKLVQLHIDQCTQQAIEFQAYCRVMGELNCAFDKKDCYQFTGHLLKLRILMRKIRRWRNGSESVNKMRVTKLQAEIDKMREKIIITRLELIFTMKKSSEELLAKQDEDIFDALKDTTSKCNQDWLLLHEELKDSLQRDPRLKRSKDLEISISNFQKKVYTIFMTTVELIKQKNKNIENDHSSCKQDLLNPSQTKNIQLINNLLKLTTKIKSLIEAFHLGLHILPENSTTDESDEENINENSKYDANYNLNKKNVINQINNSDNIMTNKENNTAINNHRITKNNIKSTLQDEKNMQAQNDFKYINNSADCNLETSTQYFSQEQLLTACSENDIKVLRKALKIIQKWLACMVPYDEQALQQIQSQIAEIELHVVLEEVTENTLSSGEPSEYAANIKKLKSRIQREDNDPKNVKANKKCSLNKNLSQSCNNIFSSPINERLV